MSHISYAFNHSDIEATAYALTVLPRLGLAESEAQAEINYQLHRYYTRRISYHYCSTPGCQTHYSWWYRSRCKNMQRMQELFLYDQQIIIHLWKAIITGIRSNDTQRKAPEILDFRGLLLFFDILLNYRLQNWERLILLNSLVVWNPSVLIRLSNFLLFNFHSVDV